jgi:hypothetical protein
MLERAEDDRTVFHLGLTVTRVGGVAAVVVVPRPGPRRLLCRRCCTNRNSEGRVGARRQRRRRLGIWVRAGVSVSIRAVSRGQQQRSYKDSGQQRSAAPGLGTGGGRATRSAWSDRWGKTGFEPCFSGQRRFTPVCGETEQRKGADLLSEQRKGTCFRERKRRGREQRKGTSMIGICQGVG